MTTMDANIFVLFLLTGAFAAAFVIGAVGFADALILNAIWLHILPPQQVTALIFACGIIMHIVPLYKLRVTLDFSFLPSFLIAGILFVPAGVYAIAQLSSENFKTVIAVLLLAYGGWMLLKPNTNIGNWGGKFADGAVGAIGGFLGGFAGLSGLLPTLWSGIRGWNKHQQRGVFQPFVLVMHVVGLVFVVFTGLITQQTWQAFLWCLPVLIIGSYLGTKIYPYINEKQFRLVVLWLLILSGLALLS